MGFLTAFQKRSSNERQQPVERFSNIISNYLRNLESKGGTLAERSLTLIARSPAAAAARALTLNAKDIERQQVSVQIVFAKLAPVDQLIELATALNITPREGLSAIRFIKHPPLLNAHEQLVLGSGTCWTGDMLRRSEEQRNGLDILEEGAPAPVRLAQFAFTAIWGAAKPVPARALTASPRRLFPAPAAVPLAIAAAELAADGTAPIRRTARVLTRH